MSAEERNARIEQALTIMIVAKFPQLANRIDVRLHPRSPYLFHAHRTDASTVIVRTSLRLNSLRDMDVIPEMARACYECLHGSTHAVRFQQQRFA